MMKEHKLCGTQDSADWDGLLLALDFFNVTFCTLSDIFMFIVCHSKFWGGPCGGSTHSTPFTCFAYRWGIVLCKHVFSYMTEGVWSISITGLHGYACNWDVCSQNVFLQKWNYTKNVQPPKALTYYWYCEWWWHTFPLINACFKLGCFPW